MKDDTLDCGACRKPIRPKAADTQAGLLRCTACGAVFDVDGRSAAGTGFPDWLQVEEGASGLTLVWTPSRRSGALAGLITLALLGASAGVLAFLPFSVRLFELAALLALMGLMLAYFSLVHLLDRGRLEVRDDVLSLKYAPLPWMGHLRVSAQEVVLVYCVERSLPRGLRYGLRARFRKAPAATLLFNFEELGQVLRLQQLLGRYLRTQE
jgi:hypothetical protein